ncbi:receptor-type tyrosine-protein phosphatase beta-like [Branchiostoma floridae x Branchiostoma japonicum]
MSVSWKGSKGDVDGYLVSISDQSVTLQEVCIKHKGRDTLMNYTFQELTPGCMYKVSVTTIREDANSLTVSPSPSRTVVSQPNGVKIVEETVYSIQVSWLESNGCKDRYHIEIFDAYVTKDVHHPQEVGEVALQRGKVDASNISQYAYTFNGLTAGTGYCIRVRAESGDDVSSWTTKDGRTVPLPPEEIDAVTRQDTDIEIRWKPGNGEYDRHDIFLYSEKVPEGVVSDTELTRANDSQTETALRETKIHNRWKEVLRPQETAHTFSDLEHGRLYVIRITTKSGNKESEPKQIMIRTTVDTPKDLRETYHDETCIAVEWNHARGVKDKYVVEVKSNDYIHSECVKASGPLKCIFDRLYPGRLYAVSVRTSCGETSSFESKLIKSEPIERFMRTTAIPPEEIFIDEDDVKEREITITWPEAQCDKDHYRVTLIPEGNEDQGEAQEDEVGSDVRVYKFRQLIPGLLYNISIRTLSERKENESKPVVLLRRTRVTEVNDLRVSKVDFTSLTVEWKPADGVQDGFQIILNHDCQLEQSKYVAHVDKVTTSEVFFDDLTEGRLYTVHVITLSGDETATAVISQRTKVSSPSKVDIIGQDSVSASQEAVTISWSRPSGDLSGYHLDIFDYKSNVSLKEKSVCIKNTRYTFRGLVAGRKYRIDVKTVSGETFSDRVSVDERTVPRPPDDVQIQEQDITLNSLKVTWKPPRDSDEDCYHLSIYNIIGGEEQEIDIPSERNIDGTHLSQRTSSNVGVSQTLEHTFKNLTAGTEYRLSVLSISAKGSTTVPNDERRSIQIEKQQMTLVAKPTLHIDEKDPDQRQKKALVLTWIPGEGKTDAYLIRVSPSDERKDSKALMVDDVRACTHATCLHREDDQIDDPRPLPESGPHYHCKVDNLECLTEYEVTMVAISFKEKTNDHRTKEFRQSNEKAHWVTFTRPDPPQGEKIYCGNESYDHSFMVYWQPPRDSESRRTTHDYKIRYQNISSENMPATQLNSHGNTQVKIENTSPGALYKIEIMSTSEVNKGNTTIRLDSSPVEVKYRTLPWVKNIARYVIASVINLAVITILLNSLSTFLGEYFSTCVGTDDSSRQNVDVYPTLAANSTPTAGTETPAPSAQACFLENEKTRTPFLTLMWMLAIWVIICIATVICWVIYNKWLVRIKMIYNDEEARAEGTQKDFVEAREEKSDLSDEEIIGKKQIPKRQDDTPDDNAGENVSLL